MMMEDQDWLERQLATENYIPDQGFTAGVVDRLVAERAQARSARRRILMAAAFVAVGLAAAQIVPLFHSLGQFAAHHSITEAFVGIAGLAHQPFFIVSVGGGMTVLAFASIPLLRRWA